MDRNQEITARYRMIESALNSSGAGIWEWNISTGEVHFDQVWLDMIGFSVEEVGHDLAGWSGLVHPDDLERVMFEVNRMLKLEVSQYLTEYRMRTKSGEYIWIRDAGRVVEFDEAGHPLLGVGTHLDISATKDSRKIIEDSLLRQELLSLVSQTLNYIDDFAGSINKALSMIGSYSDVSRIYIFEDDEAGETTTNTYEWCNAGIEPQIQNLQVIPYEFIPQWNVFLEQHGFIKSTVMAEELPADIVGMLEPQGILSILVLPIMLTPDRKHGFIGYDQCDRQRVWEPAMFELLRTCTGLLANAFKRRKSEIELRSSQQRYQALVEAQVDLVARIGVNGALTFVNRACCILLGMEEGSLVGRHISELNLVPINENSPAIGILPESLVAPPHRCYVEHGISLPGGVRWFGWEVFGICNTEDVLAEIQATGRDITAQKQYQKSLEEEKAKAQKASEAKSQFISKVSHELRTPLNSIIGFSDLMSMTELPARSMGFLTSIQKSSKHLRHLIDDLLDFAKIDSRKVKLNYSEFDLQTMMDDLFKAFSVNLTGSVKLDIRLSPGFPRLIRLDELKVRQMLNNIIGNAVKFTCSGSITVNAGFENATKESIDLLISVKDTGIGIPDDRLNQIFQSFEQIQNEEFPLTTGTGLGLSIVRAYADMFGGSIRVESQEGKGSEFVLYLPGIYCKFQQEMQDGSDSTDLPAGLPDFRGKSIMIADDDESRVTQLCEFLFPMNPQIIKVTNENEVPGLVMEFRPDLLIISLGTSFRAAAGIIGEIRLNPAVSGLPVIALGSPDDVGGDSGLFDLFLSGPLNRMAFLNSVAGSMATGSGSGRSLEQQSHYGRLAEELRETPEMAGLFFDQVWPWLLRAVSSHSLTDIGKLSKAVNHFLEMRQSAPLAVISADLARCLDFFDIQGIESHLNGFSGLEPFTGLREDNQSDN